MSRQTQAEYKAYTNNLFKTGVVGNISAASMRDFSNQLSDNNTVTYATFNSNIPHSMNLTSTPTKFTIFDEEQVSPIDNGEISTDLLNNIFNFTVEWIYRTSANLIISGDKDEVVNGQFFRDLGTGFNPIGVIGAVVLRGNNRSVALTIPASPFNMLENSKIELRIWSESGNQTVNVLNTDKKSWFLTEIIPWSL